MPTSGTTGHAAAASLFLHGTARCGLGDGRTVHLETKDALLLAWLALEGPTPRARLAALLWPEADSEHARAALRQRLARLKRSLGFEPIGAGDVASLQGLELANRADDAGKLLADVDPDPDSDLGAWLAGRRDASRGARVEALADEASRAEAAGELAAALRHAQDLVDFDPASEHAHRRVMRLHYLRGDVGAALAAFERCKQVLERTLGAPPSAETDQLARQIAAARPAHALAHPSRAPMPVTLLRTPRLIGRQRELQALRAAWESERAALLLGEAGMGKSRLLAELALAFQGDADGARVITVQARPGDAGVPYATLARLLRRVRELGDYVLEPARTRELARILPELAPLVAMPPEGHRLVLQGAAEALLAKADLAAVLVDDLHFADEASIELLQALVGSGALPRLRWGFAQRPGEGNSAAALLHATLEEGQLLVTVPLGPLTESEMRALVDSLGIAELDGARLAATLTRRTGGNPLFALEVLKHSMLNRGHADSGQTLVPVNVGALIERRLRQLSERALSLARVAAIAGVDFGIALAERVMDARAVELTSAWGELEAAQVFKDESFAHDLVHEAVLRTVPQAIARHLHAACAEHLAAAGGEPARIAAHWLEGGRDEPAVVALGEAASRARRAGRLVEAARFELTAADALDRLGRADESFDRRFQAADDTSNSAPLAFYEPIALSLVERAAGDRQDSRAAMAMAQLHFRRGAMDEGGGQLARALQAARAAGDRRIEAEALFGQGVIHHWRGRFDPALLCLESAIAILDEMRSPDRAAEMRESLAVLLRWLGRVRDAATVLENATRYLLTINSADQVGMCLCLLSLLRLDTGDETGAHEAMRQALLAAKEADFSEPHWGSMVGDGLCFALTTGDYIQALQIYEQARSDRRWGPSAHFTKVRTMAAEAMLDLGRHDLAGSILRESKSVADSGVHLEAATLLELRVGMQSIPAFLGARPREAINRVPGALNQTRLLAYLAEALPVRTARAMLGEAIALAEAFGMRGHLAGLHAAHARTLLECGKAPLAAEAAHRALDYQQRHASVVYRPLVWLRCAKVLQATGEAEAASACLADGRRWIERIAATLPDEYRSSFLNRNPINRDLRALAP